MPERPDPAGAPGESSSGLLPAQGSALGTGEGSALGTGEGSALGTGEGSALGTGEGSALGTGEGSALGTGEGSALGTGEGSALGTGEGSALGTGEAPWRVAGVLLDAGGVLVLPDPGPLRARLARFGAAPDDETCRRAHYVGMREVDRIGRPDWRAVDRVIAGVLGVPEQWVDDAVVELEGAYLRGRWVAVEGAAEALATLAAAGARLGVVSNASGTMEEELMARRVCFVGGEDGRGEHAGEPFPRVSIVVDSHLVGVEKPDPRIFGFALEALELPPEQCVYVGDTVLFDVAGARAAGIVPLHLDPFGLCPGTDHGHLASLGELAGLLGAPA